MIFLDTSSLLYIVISSICGGVHIGERGITENHCANAKRNGSLGFQTGMV